ncbi:hypothetical protein [Fluviicola sp.]|uniref:hypothetical protein n=1 Tax=Fluviicola sp. TaxID=1917219 RepID=UPI0031D008DB
MPGLTTLSLKSHFKRKLLLCFCFLFLSSVRVCGQAHSYSGMIGKYPIYLQFSVSGSHAEGYYFYKNKLVDISLTGSYKAGVVTLNSRDFYGEIAENPEIFKFKWPNQALEGTWSHNGKSLPVKLAALTTKETGSPKCSNPYLVKEGHADNDLTKVKIGLFKLKQDGPVRTVNQVKIRPFTEVLTGISLFRIDSGLVAEKQKDANLYLEYLQLTEFLTSLECASYSNYGSDLNYSFSNLAISNDLLCFSVFEVFYCGGAHPGESSYGINYHLNTHQKIESEDYLLPGKEAEFEERIYKYLSKENPGEFDEDTPDDVLECGYNDQELWTTDCNFVFTSEGIRLLPLFPHYKAPCLDPEWAVIPYSELKSVIKPEYYSKLMKLKQ